MKVSLTFFSIFSLLFLTGCSLWTQPVTPQQIDPSTTGERIIDNTQSTHTSERNIISPAYSIDLLSGSDIPLTYLGDFVVYKITHLSTNKWTYLVEYSGNWSDFTVAREDNMFDGEVMSLPTTTLTDISFNTLTGANNALRYHVQVPIDWTLLVHESTYRLYILDFDDPSGMQNKMEFEDITNILPYIELNK